MSHLWKSNKVRLRRLLLDDFHQVLGKSSAKNAPLFAHFSQRRLRLSSSLLKTSKPSRHNYRLWYIAPLVQIFPGHARAGAYQDERSTIRAASRSSQGASILIVREPIVGWRQWKFMYPHFLANLGNDTIYVPR